MIAMIVITTLAVIAIIFGTVSLFVLGFPPKDKDILDALEIHSKRPSRINSVNSGIIYIGDMPFIARVYTIIGKYYIDDVGIIPFWYKSHKKINILYKTLSPTKREKLGLTK